MFRIHAIVKRPLYARLCLASILACFFVFSNSARSKDSSDEEDTFENVEIRVIRPRYFNKEHSFEIGLGSSIVTNYDFLYTFLFNANLVYHFTEKLGLELLLAYGTSLDKDDKTTLADDSDIRPGVMSIAQESLLGLTWTPIYGKFQVSSGRVFYFDTYLAAGGGLVSIDYPHSDCVAAKENNPEQVISYPGFYGAIGQRYFINKFSSVNIRVDWLELIYNASDLSCVGTDGQKPSATTGFSNTINVGLGYSIFL